MFSLQRRVNDASIILDLMRAVAAEMVCLGHGLVFFHMPEQWRPPRLPYMQNIGVLLFFVMSGFLITSTLAQNASKTDYGFKRYFIDRFARIYSGLVPALAFIAAVDAATIWFTRDPAILPHANFSTLLANLAMFESHKGIYEHTAWQWAPFGSASPLWTLAIEWHIYMFVGAIFFIYRERPSWMLVALALFFGQTPLHYLFGALQSDGVGTGLFALWLSGAALYLALRRWVPPVWISIPTLVCAASAYCLLLTPGKEYNPVTYPALVLLVGSLIALTQQTQLLGAGKIIRRVAGYSFTLYLIHYTIMAATTTIYPAAAGDLWYWGAVLASNLIAYLIAQPFEMRHRMFADWLNKRPELLTKATGTTIGPDTEGSPRR
jgi:peptidoglycan/LPS O-acetylase OafA/YrhL